MQVVALETRIFTNEIERQRPLYPGESGISLHARAWRYLNDETGVIEALHRLQRAASRHLDDALCQLPLESQIDDLRAKHNCRETNPPAAVHAKVPGQPRSPEMTSRGTNPTGPARMKRASRHARVHRPGDCNPHSENCRPRLKIVKRIRRPRRHLRSMRGTASPATDAVRRFLSRERLVYGIAIAERVPVSPSRVPQHKFCSRSNRHAA
jgi:hypothetical protein